MLSKMFDFKGFKLFFFFCFPLQLTYKYLVVALGLQLNFSKVSFDFPGKDLILFSYMGSVTFLE